VPAILLDGREVVLGKGARTVWNAQEERSPCSVKA
jgi:hypothetical protein